MKVSILLFLFKLYLYGNLLYDLVHNCVLKQGIINNNEYSMLVRLTFIKTLNIFKTILPKSF